ncbi:hypothetical protein FRC20_009697 [Serendipita sp. 405]|nr:hypothetical protein FRC15_010611 [Serendipita sp. 397]KAG8797884.1 hypothetical protein FRC16_008433 [Serendipita sp. 398]KAG8865566.1 hypothetical protein FRC20_009697 [Serendipita sp. 405]
MAAPVPPYQDTPYQEGQIPVATWEKLEQVCTATEHKLFPMFHRWIHYFNVNNVQPGEDGVTDQIVDELIRIGAARVHLIPAKAEGTIGSDFFIQLQFEEDDQLKAKVLAAKLKDVSLAQSAEEAAAAAGKATPLRAKSSRLQVLSTTGSGAVSPGGTTTTPGGTITTPGGTITTPGGSKKKKATGLSHHSPALMPKEPGHKGLTIYLQTKWFKHDGPTGAMVADFTYIGKGARKIQMELLYDTVEAAKATNPDTIGGYLLLASDRVAFISLDVVIRECKAHAPGNKLPELHNLDVNRAMSKTFWETTKKDASNQYCFMEDMVVAGSKSVSPPRTGSQSGVGGTQGD